MTWIPLAVHAIGAGAYWWLQPRGFAIGGRSWFEHEVIVPAVFAISIAGLVPRMRLLAAGLLLGFWLAVAGTIGAVGWTLPARAMIVVVAVALVVLALLLRGDGRRPVAVSAPIGAALGAAFMWCTWAPPATTRPAGGAPPPEARPAERDGVFVRHGEARKKGPFTTIASWEPHDPWIESQGRRIQVRGWVDQASRAESPTAGWGVSQGTIENVGGMLVWSLASTSVGRGWHCVRTAPGTYAFEVVITRR